MNHLSIRSHIIWNTLFIYVSGRLWYSRATSNVVPAGLSHLQAQVPQRVGDSNRAGQVVLANAPLFLNLGCFSGSMLGGDHWGVVITYFFCLQCVYIWSYLITIATEYGCQTMWINHVVPDQPWQPWLPFSRHGGASTSGSGPHQRQPAPYATSRWGPQWLWLRGEPLATRSHP